MVLEQVFPYADDMLSTFVASIQRSSAAVDYKVDSPHWTCIDRHVFYIHSRYTEILTCWQHGCEARGVGNILRTCRSGRSGSIFVQYHDTYIVPTQMIIKQQPLNSLPALLSPAQADSSLDLPFSPLIYVLSASLLDPQPKQADDVVLVNSSHLVSRTRLYVIDQYRDYCF